MSFDNSDRGSMGGGAPYGGGAMGRGGGFGRGRGNTGDANSKEIRTWILVMVAVLTLVWSYLWHTSN